MRSVKGEIITAKQLPFFVEIDDFFGAYESRGFDDLHTARDYAALMSQEYARVNVLAYSTLTFRYEVI